MVKHIRCIEVLRGDLGEAMARQETVQYSSSSGRHNDSGQRSPGGSRERADPASGKGPQDAALGEALVELTDEGYLMLVLPPGEVITGSMAAGFADTIDRLTASSSLPLLITLTGVESISRSARDVFSSTRSLAAVAVVGVSPVDQVIANFLLGGEVQPCPTRYFSQEDEALNWLKRYAA